AGDATHAFDDIVRSLAVRLIHHQRAVKRRRLGLRSHEYWRSLSLRLRLVGFLGLPQEFLDAPAVLLRAIEHKLNFGPAVELQPLGQLMADVARGGPEASERRGLLDFGAQDTDEDAGLLQIGRHAYLRHGHEAGQARILQLAGQHGADFVPDFFCNPFVAMASNRHLLFLVARLKRRALLASSKYFNFVPDQVATQQAF